MSSAKSRTSMERTSKAETAIGDLNAEVEQLMMTMSQVVHGTAPAATGGGRRGGESRDGRHTVPGTGQRGLDRGPNTEGQQVFCLGRQEPFYTTATPRRTRHHPWGTSDERSR